VPEVAGSGEDHGDTTLVRGGDDLGVTDGAARLDGRGGTRYGGGAEQLSVTVVVDQAQRQMQN